MQEAKFGKEASDGRSRKKEMWRMNDRMCISGPAGNKLVGYSREGRDDLHNTGPVCHDGRVVLKPGSRDALGWMRELQNADFRLIDTTMPDRFSEPAPSLFVQRLRENPRTWHSGPMVSVHIAIWRGTPLPPPAYCRRTLSQ